MATNESQRPDQPFEQEKWETEKAFRERELSIKEREQLNREADLDLKRKELKSAGWRSPLVVAIIAATMAAAGNAVVSIVNGNSQRQLENQKSEQARILEMIKTGDPDKAANNLEFLLNAGLISDPKQQVKLQEFLDQRKPGSGPTLPSQSGFPLGGIVGPDDAVEVNKLAADKGLKQLSMAVGQIKAVGENNTASQCTAFLVGPDLVLTVGHCIKGVDSAELLMFDGSTETSYKINLPPLEISSELDGLNYALLRIDGKPGEKYGILRLSSTPPAENQALSMILFRSSNQKLAITGAPDCRVFKLEQNVFHHLCDSGPGSSGAPILSVDGNRVLGIHSMRDGQGGVAIRMDQILSSSKILQSGKE